MEDFWKAQADRLIRSVGRAVGSDDDGRVFEVLEDRERLEDLAGRDEDVRRCYADDRVGETVRVAAVSMLRGPFRNW